MAYNQHYYSGAQYVPGAGSSASPQERTRSIEYASAYPPPRVDRYRGGAQIQKRMTQREDVLKFEQGRIKALQEERLHIQKKTFTKWINSFLLKARMEVDDLFTDLADGKKLLKLLEIISGERLAKPNNGRMRVHKIENVNKSLAFLHTKMSFLCIPAIGILQPCQECAVSWHRKTATCDLVPCTFPTESLRIDTNTKLVAFS